MFQDLHSHTYYSFDGKNRPEEVVEAAIAGGIRLFGITDHNFGIGLARYDVFSNSSSELTVDYYRTLQRYYDHISLVREKYRNQITVLRGVEVNLTRDGRLCMPEGTDVSYFDYVLLECLNHPNGSIANGDLFSYAEKMGCKCGIAHTDMFAFIKSIGEDPLTYFRKMAERGIFWEMNVNYDSIHHYHVYPYLLNFFESEQQQDIIRRSGVEISVGFDGHWVEDYLPERIKDYCRHLEKMGIRMAFE